MAAATGMVSQLTSGPSLRPYLQVLAQTQARGAWESENLEPSLMPHRTASVNPESHFPHVDKG